MPSPFEVATSVERIDDHHFRSVVPPGWEQGRGAFGGLVLGTLARAMIASEPDTSRSLRLLSGEICAPVLAKETRIEVVVIRRGKNLTNLDARMWQDGAIVARASAGLSVARPTAGEVREPSPAPNPPPFDAVTSHAMPSPFRPAFTQHFEYRSTGPAPFSGGAEPIVEGYMRESEPLSALDAPALIARLDSYWPAIFSTETRPRAAATVSFSAQLLGDASAIDPSVPMFHRATVTAMRDGFFVEMRELWHEGTLIGLNQQTFALLA